MIDIFPASATLPLLRLNGKKVFLRPAEKGDWEEWVDLRQKSRSFLVPWEPTWPADCLSRGFWHRRLKYQQECWRHDLGYHFIIFQHDDSSAMLGGISLSYVRRTVSQSAVLGYWIGQPYTRQGYVTDAITVLLDHAFSREGFALHRIEAGCLPRNVASRSVLRKLGFCEEGIARGYLRINGAWEDHIVYSMLEEDWVRRSHEESHAL